MLEMYMSGAEQNPSGAEQNKSLFHYKKSQKHFILQQAAFYCENEDSSSRGGRIHLRFPLCD